MFKLIFHNITGHFLYASFTFIQKMKSENNRATSASFNYLPVQLLASSLEYPQRIEWSQSLNRVSVWLSVLCLLGCVSANFLIFPSFILLFLYSTVQKSAVQYSYWPTPSSIHRRLEWPQWLNRLFAWLFFVCLIVLCSLSANFLIFLLLILLSVVLSPLLFIYIIIAVMYDIDTSWE